MLAISQSNIVGASLAGGVLCAELLETLFDKGVLTRDECRAVLTRAMSDLSLVAQTTEGHSAQRIIGSLQAGKFTERS